MRNAGNNQNLGVDELPKLLIRFVPGGETMEYKPPPSSETPEQELCRCLLEETYKKNNWVEFVENISQSGRCTVQLRSSFHTLWVEKGHCIRSRLGNDDLLTKMLRTLLPPYKGEGLWLYRGENLDRFLANKLGFCWTTKRNVAETFARGLNACGLGGVLLYAWAPADVILSDVSSHSRYLGENELTVVGSSVEKVQELERFPPNSDAFPQGIGRRCTLKSLFGY